MKMKLAALAVLALAFTAKAQAPTTENWTNNANARCQSSVTYPSYYCNGTTTTGSSWAFYITVQPDGTFSNGTFTLTNYDGTPSFTAVNWAGANLSGSFSGTNPDGTLFSGNATEVLGQVRICAGRYSCHYVTGVVSGNG